MKGIKKYPFQEDNKNLFVVNQVDSITAADIDAKLSHYNHLSATELEPVHKNFESAIGMSYETFTAKIPVTFVSKSFYSVDVPADAKTEYIPHDKEKLRIFPIDFCMTKCYP